MTKYVCQLDQEGYFAGLTEADESPLEPGEYLVPANCVDVEPPQGDEDQVARWDFDAQQWVIESAYVPAPEDEEVWDDPEEKARVNSYLYKRASEYPNVKDYLDGLVKGDLEQMQAYIDACLAVKAKYPKDQYPYIPPTEEDVRLFNERKERQIKTGTGTSVI